MTAVDALTKEQIAEFSIKKLQAEILFLKNGGEKETIETI